MTKKQEYHKKWYIANREKLLAYSKKWAKEHPDKRKAAHLRYKAKYPDRVKMLVRESRLKLRQEVLSAYGNKCVCCGQTESDFLTVDHINGGGSAHLREIGPADFYSWLKRNGFPKEEFQLLCWNCNMSKGRYGSCPHTRKKPVAIDIPPDAECAMIPFKWLKVLQEIAHGPFIPIDFPLPIVVSKMVPDDEIWFARVSKILSTAGDIEILKKEKISNEMFKTDDISSSRIISTDADDRLLQDNLQAPSGVDKSTR